MKNNNSILKRAIHNPRIVFRYLKKKMLPFNYYLNTGHASPPAVIYVNINNVCNLQCKMCDIGQKNMESSFYKNLKSGKALPIDDWKKFIDQVTSFKPVIHINGTEPLLYKDIIEFIKYAKNKDVRCHLTTNGTLLEQHAEQLVENGLEKLFVSIDGPEEIHDEIRGVKGTFKKASAGIIKVGEIKNKLGVDTPHVVVNSTISNYNYDKLYDTVIALKDLGLEAVHICHLDFKTKDMVSKHNQMVKDGKLDKKYMTTESSLSAVVLNEIKTEVVWKEISKIKDVFGKFVSFDPELNHTELKKYYENPEENIKINKCLIPWKTAQICSDGTVIPLDRCMSVNLGNITEKSFLGIWNGKSYRDFRKTIKKNKSLPVCVRCGGLLY